MSDAPVQDSRGRRAPVQGRSQETVQRVLAAASALLARGVPVDALTTASIATDQVIIPLPIGCPLIRSSIKPSGRPAHTGNSPGCSCRQLSSTRKPSGGISGDPAIIGQQLKPEASTIVAQGVR